MNEMEKEHYQVEKFIIEHYGISLLAKLYILLNAGMFNAVEYTFKENRVIHP